MTSNNTGLESSLDLLVTRHDDEAVRDKQSLLALRDRIVRTWQLAKAPEKRERIKEALDRFIERLKSTLTKE